ncbi:uncharacterized protein LOC117646123 isoform X2 [Thrips palmi]|uniref:Uncharacterized protein LOC117646123 isoform X2 n=1 Tax=Thrips palmi TaxID=161013 RepID=A0A6P8YYI2_THRPL|nr:uncharacterized protein LOC117646123 isoform X2 [Thrips palmi]
MVYELPVLGTFLQVLLLPPKSTCIRSVPRGDSFPTDAAPRVPVWRKMECQICLENFNVADHRPKTLPCGHSFCLQCLKRLPTKTCPNDSLPFFGSADALADNFTVIKLCSQRPMQMHCKKCNRVATTTCEDEQHEVLSLRRARAQDAGPVLAALRRAEERLDKLGKALVECLDEERAGLAAARARLQEAMGASPDAWEQAKQAALSRSAVELADPAQARLLLGRLVSGGALGVHSAPVRRPVGRPPKESVGSSPKKPRGRPRKKPVGSSPKRPVGSFPEKPVGSSAKKPRGRPRKKPVGSSPKRPVGSFPEKPVGSSAKKPRGRPRKKPVGSSPKRPVGSFPEKPVGSSSKRPRGRPPKRPVGSSPGKQVGGSPRMPVGSSPETPLETPRYRRFTLAAQIRRQALSRSSVELADPAQARLVLSRLPSGGALQVPEERHGAKRRHSMIEGLGQRAPAPCSQERSSGAARSLPVGTRVVRGPHWGKTWTYDGTPPRPGTVRVWYEENLRAEVKWDSGVTQWVSYGQNYKYHVVPLTDLGSAPQQ